MSTRTTPTPAIELQGVSKRYWQLRDRAMLLKSILPFARPDRTELWALKDVSFSIPPGETVGLLGRNGAGKTTLLRMLAGVSSPTSGSIAITGPIAPLLSVGVGFHHEMSGRENVYVNGMLLGLTRAQVEERFDEIVAFAELEDHIDTPVKFYSSGMFMRLGFSVAAHVDPRVLLVDEVLAVGDLAFQFKCLDHMRKLQERGTTIVIVSHNVTAIRLLCPRALVMAKGQLDFDGDSASAVARHYELLSLQADEVPAHSDSRLVGGVRLQDRTVEVHGVPATTLPQHEPVVVRHRFVFDRPVDSPEVVFTVVAESGATAYQFLPTFGTKHRVVEAGDVVEADIEFVNRLAGGTYQLLTTVLSNDGRDVLYQDAGGVFVYVEPRLGSVGVAELDAIARVDGVDVSDHGPVMLSRTASADAL